MRRDKRGREARVETLGRGQVDEVTVAIFDCVHGLEQPVVVWLAGRCQGADDEFSDEQIDASDRVHLVSRCTTQLIIVDVPR
jgi:hypothetical protein